MGSTDEDNWAVPVQRLNSYSQSVQCSTSSVSVPVKEEAVNQNHVLNNKSAERIRHPSDENLCASFLFGIFYTIFCVGLFLPVFCVVMILLPISIAVRRVCFWVSCGFCGSKSLLSAGDNLWLQRYQSSRTHALHEVNFPVLNVLLITEGSFSATRLIDIIGERWVYLGHESRNILHPRFTCRLQQTCAGYVLAKDEYFNINNHITELKENSPRTKETLERYIAEVSCKTFSYERPLWEIKLIPNFGQEQCTAILFRVHHALMDGICLTRMTLESLIDSPLCVLHKKFYFRVSSFFMTALSLLLGPIRILELLFWRKKESLICGSKLSGARTMVWSDAVSLKIVRKIRNATRTTVNEVLISCLCGALRKYLQHHGDCYPKDMRACVPTDLRSKASPLVAENNFAMVFLKLPVGTEGAIPRLWEIRRRIRTVKHSTDTHIMSYFVRLCMTIFPQCISRPVIDFFINKASCVFTSMAGPDVPVTLDDKRIRILTFWAPLKAKIGLGFSVYSYMNEIRLGIIADEAIMHDPKLVAKEFESEVLQLSEHLANRIHVYQGLARRHSLNQGRDHGEGTSTEDEEEFSDNDEEEPGTEYEEYTPTSPTVVEVQNVSL